MTAFTLRIDDSLAKELDSICNKKGFSKTGLIKSLIRDFLSKEKSGKTKKQDLTPLVGVVTLGGDAVKDAADYFS